MNLKLLLLLFLIASGAAAAQPGCFTQEQVSELVAQLEHERNPSPNKSLRKELIDIKQDVINRYTSRLSERQRANVLTNGIFGIETRIETREGAVERMRDRSESRLCEIFRKYGWPLRSVVGNDGSAAIFYIVKNFASFEFQMELVPLIAAALKRDEIARNEDYASFLDRLRLRAGLRQLFGTQAFERNGFLFIAPLQSRARVDEWRKEYKMPPLGRYLKFLEFSYKMPTVISQMESAPILIRSSEPKVPQSESGLGLPTDAAEEELPIRIDTNLVNLSLRVFADDFGRMVGDLTESDFRIFENGIEQKIGFFSRTERPFDLVLLLDLSGSTAAHQDLIRRSARRFVESSRSGDRIGIVTFSTGQDVVSELTTNKAKLVRAISKIGDLGQSRVWDSLIFALERMFDRKASDRRRIVVVMTDGGDNSLLYDPRFGSLASFAELVESVRLSESTVVPIFLKTSNIDVPCVINSPVNCTLEKRVAEQSRGTLAFLAEESGGQMYPAKRYEDLDAVYENVLRDFGTDYAIGYQPTDGRRDGTWRAIRVEAANRSGLTVRTRRGYYAR